MDKIPEHITEYEYSGTIDSAEIKDAVKGSLLKKRKLADKIKHFIIYHVAKFTF